MDKEELLKKWLSDDLTDAELKEFKQSDDFDINNQIIEDAQLFKASHFSKAKSYDEFKMNLDRSIDTPVRKLPVFNILYRVAAIFVIALGVYFTFFSNNLTTIETLASKKTTFQLPDASSVTLNALSTVEYSKKKWTDKRELTLDGEAFFKVAKGSKFDVKTSSGVVSVFGTQFTVKQRNNYFEVKCFEGIVGVKRNDIMQKLTRGKTYRVVEGVIILDSININLPKWLGNTSSFKSVPLHEVLSEFERQYNVTISAENIDTKRLFTGGFVHTNLEEALMAITEPFELKFKKGSNSNKIIITSNNK